MEPDIPDLLCRTIPHLVCGSGMRHTHCRVGDPFARGATPRLTGTGAAVGMIPSTPQTHVRLLCLFSYDFIITLWVEFAREICPPVRIQSSVPKSRAKPNRFLGRISRGTRSGQIPRRRVSLSHRRCRRRCPGCGLAGEESLRRMSRGRQLPRCLRVVWRGGRKVCLCRAGNGCWRMGFLVRLE